MDTFNHTHSGDQAYDTVCPLLIRDLNWHRSIGRFYTFNLNGSDRVDYLAVVRKDFVDKFLEVDRVAIMGTPIHRERAATACLGIYPSDLDFTSNCLGLSHVTIGPSPEPLEASYVRIDWGTVSQKAVDKKREEFYQDLAAAQNYRRTLVVTAV